MPLLLPACSTILLQVVLCNLVSSSEEEGQGPDLTRYIKVQSCTVQFTVLYTMVRLGAVKKGLLWQQRDRLFSRYTSDIATCTMYLTVCTAIYCTLYTLFSRVPDIHCTQCTHHTVEFLLYTDTHCTHYTVEFLINTLHIVHTIQ